MVVDRAETMGASQDERSRSEKEEKSQEERSRSLRDRTGLKRRDQENEIQGLTARARGLIDDKETE